MTDGFLLPRIVPLQGPAHAALSAGVQRRLDHLTKPRGALGRLETLALQVATVLGSDRPQWRVPQLVVCAADHGLAAQGVSAYPQAVTAQMVANMLAGGAAVSVLARQHGLALTVVDCGVASQLEPAPAAAVASASVPVPGLAHGHGHGHGREPTLYVAKTVLGTADSSAGPAMSEVQCESALAAGAALLQQLPGNVVLLGEMGIGNTSAAALLMCRLTGLPLADCVGRGTGLDDAALAHKQAVLARVLQRHAAVQGPRALLAALGGAEIATLAGLVLQAAAERRVVVVDGFITTAAVAVAAAMAAEASPQGAAALLQRCVFAHASAESGHARWLAVLGVQPLLDLGLRLGEGSGAALAWPLLVSALALLDGMASFDSAGVSGPSGARVQCGDHGICDGSDISGAHDASDASDVNHASDAVGAR